MDVKVSAIHFDADRKLVDFVHQRINKLDLFFDNIISAQVYLRIDKSKGIDNKIAEIKLFVPGKDLFAKKQCKSFEEATDITVEALRRQVKKHKEKLRTV